MLHSIQTISRQKRPPNGEKISELGPNVSQYLFKLCLDGNDEAEEVEQSINFL